MNVKLPLWTPDTIDIQQSHIFQFMQLINKKKALKLSNYNDLYQWSIQNRSEFWELLSQYTDFPFFQPYHEVLTYPDDMKKSRWFTGSKINYMHKIMMQSGKEASIISRNEQGYRKKITRDELNILIQRVANGLKSAGLRKGDRLAAYMPNCIESVIAFLACASLGVIWSACSTEFGVQTVLNRFKQIKPKALLVIPSVYYKGHLFDLSSKITELSQTLPSVSVLIQVSPPDQPRAPKPQLDQSKYFIAWEELLQYSEIGFSITPVPFDHPLYILYSSGTTGAPKCIVHGHGGSLLQHLKEHQLHTNIKPHDRLFYFTTCGWMMWNWLVSGLASGACLILYDGSPLHPNMNTLWHIAEKEKINVFGTSANYLHTLFKLNYQPNQTFSLPHLKTILSTGSPLSPQVFDFVYNSIKSNILLSSISGGTDIVSCFVLGNPMLPVYRGQIQCIGLGMAVDFLNESGTCEVGRKGELICTKSFPSMPIKFWNDPKNESYHQAYFASHSTYWQQGDLGEKTLEGGIILHGRSDCTLNPGGVRIGTAEIYEYIHQIPQIKECLAVGQQWKETERIILFVTLISGYALTSELKEMICKTLKREASPRHVPAKIIEVSELPKTRNGKLSETAIKLSINHQSTQQFTNLESPELLEKFKSIPELMTD
ncbi:MAG: acetoacetate--CoA ligase [Endozoicomonadaceae bacterium]|nr:acetoacetate--CoA ligase [Endozoicomonadaceae bacterium]